MMQDGTLTSLALYDQYCINMAHEQQLTSESRSHIDNLIPSDNIIVIA